MKKWISVAACVALIFIEPIIGIVASIVLWRKGMFNDNN